MEEAWSMTTMTMSRTITEPSYLRVRMSPAAKPTADDMESMIDAIFDQVALGIALYHPGVEVHAASTLLADTDSTVTEDVLGATLRHESLDDETVIPLYHLVPQLRFRQIQVVHVSYASPLEILISLLEISAATATAAAAFVDLLRESSGVSPKDGLPCQLPDWKYQAATPPSYRSVKLNF